jgi:hypothetical protein
MLGYDPNMGLEEGLRRTFEYYSDAVKNQQA